MGKTEEDVLGMRSAISTTFHDRRDHAQSVNGNWLTVLRRYLLFAAVANLVWEVLQLPLYTIWSEATGRKLTFAVLHCTGGDLLITLSSLVLALILVGYREWPAQGFTRVAGLAIVFGVSYTVFSEWLNIVVRKSWAYSELMPVIPVIDTGLSPFAQWIVIPLAGFWWARRPFTVAAQLTGRHA
jgi:hypothetical protein